MTYAIIVQEFYHSIVGNFSNHFNIEGVSYMFKIQEIRELIRLIDQSSIQEFTYENEGTSITLKKYSNAAQPVNIVPQAPVQDEQPAQPAASAPVQNANPTAEAPVENKVSETPKQETKTEDDANYVKITSPMVGTFYAAPAPDKPPYVKVGDKVKEDTVVCIVEAMKLFNEIEAEVSGEIVEVLVENGQLVEYGQPLFLVKPE